MSYDKDIPPNGETDLRYLQYAITRMADPQGRQQMRNAVAEIRELRLYREALPKVVF